MYKFTQQVEWLFSKPEKAQAVGKRNSANKRRQAEASGDSDEASKEGAHALRDREQAYLDCEQPLKDEEASKDQQASEGLFPVVEMYSRADSKRPEGSQKHKPL
ncbi:hypothetical protein LTR28_009627 [Elasticomyces elasticus]|nr:hypothetical protein LTR28_009627 [Elasticomyces elasticus]